MRWARVFMPVTTSQDRELERTIVRIQAGVLALTCAIVGGLGLFLMTAWLLIKGGPNVGAHLQLLGQYLIGYSVTWTGSLIGFFYGALIGAVVGWTVGAIYNSIVHVRQRRSGG
jgi:predicted DNA repair protein MutK